MYKKEKIGGKMKKQMLCIIVLLGIFSLLSQTLAGRHAPVGEAA